MKVQLADMADLEVWIEFAYDRKLHTEEHPGSGKVHVEQREITRCLIRDGSAPRAHHGEAPVLATGEVVRYYLDPPNRELARKAALTKALQALDDQGLSYATFLHDRVRLSKERRKLFWDAYLNRKRPAAKTSAP